MLSKVMPLRNENFSPFQIAECESLGEKVLGSQVSGAFQHIRMRKSPSPHFLKGESFWLAGQKVQGITVSQEKK